MNGLFDLAVTLPFTALAIVLFSLAEGWAIAIGVVALPIPFGFKLRS